MSPAKSTYSIPFGARRKDPFFFKTFFTLGLEESASPFLTEPGRKIAKNLDLKVACFAALLLLVAFLLHSGPISDIFLLFVYVIVGVPALINSIDDLTRKKELNIDVLTTIAAFSAYFLDSDFEGALLLVLFTIAGALESTVTLQTKNALSLVHSLAPTMAYVTDSRRQVKEKAVDDVSVGTHIRIRTGELVPLDGVIIEGTGALSFAHLTGEVHPIRKAVGDEVPSGAQLMEGALIIRVTHTKSDSTAARIIELMTKAEQSKPKLEREFDRFGRIYALAIIGLSICSIFAMHIVMQVPYWGVEGSIYRSLAFLITASPCALILAVPISYLSTLGVCAKKGAIMKGGVVLDAMNACNAIALDKTGTLTQGELSLETIEFVRNDAHVTKDEVLALAASLEQNAVHPIARAICTAAAGMQLYHVDGIKVAPGIGVEGDVSANGHTTHLFIGLNPHGSTSTRTKAAQATGKVVAVFISPTVEAVFILEDKLRPGAKGAIEQLKKELQHVFMFTGDAQEAARKIATQLDIHEWCAQLTPEGKLEKIDALSKSYGLIMCGDGMNDAPALARATVGISMGKIGAAAAKQAADCILLQDELSLIPWLLKKAAKTRTIVRQNLTFALIAIVITSIPALSGVLPLWLAILFHEGSTVLVSLNALRLFRK